MRAGCSSLTRARGLAARWFLPEGPAESASSLAATAGQQLHDAPPAFSMSAVVHAQRLGGWAPTGPGLSE